MTNTRACTQYMRKSSGQSLVHHQQHLRHLELALDFDRYGVDTCQVLIRQPENNHPRVW